MTIDVLGPGSAANAVTSRPTDSRVFGVTDTWFKDCTAPNVDDGTAFQAAWFNGVLAQMRQAIRGQGITEDNTNDLMLLRAIMAASVRPGTDTGAKNHLVCTLIPPITGYFEGLLISVLVAVTNDSATDISVDGAGAKAIKTSDGAALTGGELIAGQRAILVYTAGAFQIANVASQPVARRLRGVSAFASGVTGIPTSVATRVAFGGTENVNLVTSTWTGSRLTVGAGEDGLWIFTSCAHLPLPAGGFYVSESIYVNGIERARGSNSAGNGGDAQAPMVAAIIKLNAGDYAEAYAYQQSGGTINTTGSTLTRFSAFLIAKP